MMLELRLPPDSLSKIGLVVGLACVRMLAPLGIAGLGIKWPNDVLVEGRKLGGVLVEYEVGHQGQGILVIGVGINTSLPNRSDPGGGYSATDLLSVVGRPRLPGRSRLAADLVTVLLDAMDRYSRDGWAGFAEDWARFDLVKDRQVSVLLPDGTALSGQALGIDSEGAMRVSTRGGEVRCLAGEVSLRTPQ
jgi:BirA family biotin operon repressor/biotin-[acetyl-CoA-carboxylase] ligase